MNLVRQWVPGESPGPSVAIGIQATGNGNTHIGIAYCQDDESNEMRWMHLAFHCLLRIQDVDPACLYFVPNLSVEDAEVVASRCRRNARSRPKKDSYFDDDGHLLPDDNKGLNCSTFVLVTFRSVGVQLVLEETWPERSDDGRRFAELHRQLADYIRRYHPGDERHLERIAPDIASVRIRPEETAGVCQVDQLPVAFEQAEPQGRAILALLYESPPGL
jgi:hypothetical protein